jgi:hypothetical protein
MKPFLLLALAFLLGGCTVVGVREPVGTPVSEVEAEKLAGRWLGPDRMSITVVSSEGVLVASWQEDDKPKQARFTVTQVAKDILVGWGQVDNSPFVTPVRLIPGEKSFVLLRPDEKEIKALIAAGALRSAPEGSNTNLFIEPAGVLAAMAGKNFWDLSWAVPLLKDGDKPAPAAP